jgi:acyl-CoA synthetase (AMP-forming)/AMP-acid ligase II
VSDVRWSSATTTAVLAAVAAEQPEGVFVIADDGELTYGEAATRCAAISSRFEALGLKPGDRVGILLPNGIRWCCALLAAHAAGLSVVPLNTWYRIDELERVLVRSRVRAVITQNTIFGHDFGTDLSSIAGRLDPNEFFGTFEWPADADEPTGLPPTADSAALAVLTATPSREQDEALLMFTSGSTAEPKAVRLSQRGLVLNAHAIGERQGVRATDRFWFASPLFFVFGCANALPNTLTHGATLCVQERFDPALALQFIERHRCSVYYGVAPVTRALVACPDLACRDISSLRTGTANATPDDLRLVIDVLGVTRVCNAYGMTEGYGHTTLTDHTDSRETRINSQGRPLPTQELRICDDAGEETPASQPGHILIRGAITSGYLDGESPTFDDDGWFRTGDVGHLDAEGRLHFLGRSSDMMKVKGINIAPAEVELVLARHPRVSEVFVFGLPTAEGDEEVGCALVSETAPGEHAELVADVTAWARTQMAKYKIPTAVRVLRADQLPLTATGKVSKRALQESDSSIPS